ncbi:MAG TPA: YsnF/AvaK domain-containing protein [Bryobacteraceae bacterium]
MTDKEPEARQIALPLYEEAVTVSKRVVPKNRVRVSTVTHQRRQLVDELLQRENVEIGRISIGRPIEAVPAVREEDDTIIVPVVEEVLTLQRTLILKEEVRIRKVRTEERYQESVTLRSQQAGITRLPVEERTGRRARRQTNEEFSGLGPASPLCATFSRVRSRRVGCRWTNRTKKGVDMNYEKVVALFDTPENAEATRRNLEGAGFPGSEISIVSSKTLAAAGETLREPGLWRRLFGRDIEKYEATVYGRAVESGGVVLTLRAPESDVPRAMGILNAHSVVDVQDRAVQQGLISKETVIATPPPKAGAAAATVTTPIPREQVLRLAEEQLDVGKRLVQDGTTRIRRFVTEKPIEAKVSLHEEHAQVIRRAVADPKSLKDIDWSDQTIEVIETAEEAVVSKSAHIAEEVIISKEGSDRVETVRDTVRRQQVEVERKNLRKAS